MTSKQTTNRVIKQTTGTQTTEQPIENWQTLAKIMQQLQLDDAPVGGSLVVYRSGKCVLDTSVGNAQQDISWTSKTLSLNFSTGKGVLATLVHVLVSQGLLEYDKPICHYWTEFANNGKAGITVKQVMSHQADLFALNSVIKSYTEMLDWQSMLTLIENMHPQAPIARENQTYATAYSALIYGWVLGGLIEKVTNTSLQDALEHFLTKPLGIESQIYFKLPKGRVAEVAQPARNFKQDDLNEGNTNRRRIKPILKPDSEQTLQTYASLPNYAEWQALFESDVLHADDGNQLTTADINKLYFDPANLNIKNYTISLMPNAKESLDYYDTNILQKVIPAANCVATARALAKMYAMLANGGNWQGQQLINKQTFAKISQIQARGQDAVMPVDMQWRLGYHRVFSVIHNVEQGMGHIGYNGSYAWCDPTRELAIAFVHNYDTTMLNDVRAFAITEAVLSYVDSL